MLPLTEKGTCTIVKKLDSLKNKPKDTFKVVNFLLDRQCNKNVYPNDQNDRVVAEDLNSLFNEKINKIYKEIKSKTLIITICLIKMAMKTSPTYPCINFPLFQNKSFVMLSKAWQDKSCGLDPIAM